MTTNITITRIVEHVCRTSSINNINTVHIIMNIPLRIVTLTLVYITASAIKWEEYQPNAYRVGIDYDTVNGSLPTEFNIVHKQSYIMHEYNLTTWSKGYKGYYRRCGEKERHVVPIPVPSEVRDEPSGYWMAVIKQQTVYRQPEGRHEVVTQEGGKVVFITGRIFDDCDGPEMFIPLKEMSVEDASHYFG